MSESLEKKKEKKASSPTSLRVNTWIMFHSLYIESLFLYFFLSQSRSISSTFLSPSQISVDAFPRNFSLFLSVALNFRLAIRVTFQVIFSGGFRVTFQVIQEGVILERFPQYSGNLIEWSELFYPRDFVVNSLLAQFLAVSRNVLKKATLSTTQLIIFSICHKLF